MSLPPARAGPATRPPERSPAPGLPRGRSGSQHPDRRYGAFRRRLDLQHRLCGSHRERPDPQQLSTQGTTVTARRRLDHKDRLARPGPGRSTLTYTLAVSNAGPSAARTAGHRRPARRHLVCSSSGTGWTCNQAPERSPAPGLPSRSERLPTSRSSLRRLPQAARSPTPPLWQPPRATDPATTPPRKEHGHRLGRRLDHKTDSPTRSWPQAPSPTRSRSPTQARVPPRTCRYRRPAAGTCMSLPPARAGPATRPPERSPAPGLPSRSERLPTSRSSFTAPSAGGSISNTASVAATRATRPRQQLLHARTTVTPVADLAVTKTDGVGAVNAGGSTTYTLRSQRRPLERHRRDPLRPGQAGLAKTPWPARRLPASAPAHPRLPSSKVELCLPALAQAPSTSSRLGLCTATSGTSQHRLRHRSGRHHRSCRRQQHQHHRHRHGHRSQTWP